MDPVRDVYGAISGAADLSQVLDALVDGVGALFPRAALFVVKTKSKRLQGWRSVGFTGVAAITREFEFPLTTDSALTRAVTASRTIFTGDAQSPAHGAEAWTVTFPVTNWRPRRGRRARRRRRTLGEPVAVFDRETALDLGHKLVRTAGERIGALTMSARAAFGSVVNVAPADGAPRAAAITVAWREKKKRKKKKKGARRPSVAWTPPDWSPRSSFQKSIATARRQRPRRLSTASGNGSRGRLKARGRRQRLPAAGTALGLFDEALGKMLGNGALEQESVPIPSIPHVRSRERIETCHPNPPPRCGSWKR